MPVKCQSDWLILITNLAASRFFEVLQEDVLSDIEMGFRVCMGLVSEIVAKYSLYQFWRAELI